MGPVRLRSRVACGGTSLSGLTSTVNPAGSGWSSVSAPTLPCWNGAVPASPPATWTGLPPRLWSRRPDSRMQRHSRPSVSADGSGCSPCTTLDCVDTNTSDWVTHVDLVFPQDANPLGTMFGGRVMQIMDVNSAIVAFRFCRRAAVTASSEPIDFRGPIRVGDIIEVRSRLAWAGHSSMIIRNEVYSEHPLSGERNLCTIGHMNFVALGEDGLPTAVPELELRDDEERAHWREGKLVREQLLARREAQQRVG